MKNKALLLLLLVVGVQSNTTSLTLLANGYDPKEVLLHKGFSEEEINRLSNFTINQVAEQIMQSNEFVYQFFALSETQDDSIETRGIIDEEELSLIITASNYVYDVGFLSEIYVKFYYDWINFPTWRLEDPIAITWDANFFDLVFGSFYQEDRYYRKGDYLFSNGENFYCNDNTITWDAKLQSDNFLGIGGTITKLYGFGEFRLTTKANYENINTSLISNYYHSKKNNVILTLGSQYGYSVSGDNDSANKTLPININ